MSRLLVVTERQRTALNRLWARYRRALFAKQPRVDPEALQKEIEDTLAANLSGYNTAAEAQADAARLTNRRRYA